jgi:hypothetical protein
MNKGFMAGLCFALLVLNGCIEQDVKIKLNADGSGQIEVVRNLSKMESGMELLGAEEADGFETMTVKRSVEEVEGAPFQKVERTIYTFTNLAESLPELENAVAMMPRFTIREDRLVVFIRHEMNEYHGFRQTDKTNTFYHLEIEFPAPPMSESGQVEGNRFVWKVDHDALDEFSRSKIGTLAFECSVPSSAIKLDLLPRLVKYDDSSSSPLEQKEKTRWIHSLNVNVPIIAKMGSSREGENATMGMYLPVDQTSLPLCYENLRVEQLVIDGIELAAELKTNPAGVFSGTDQWGRPAPGLPIELRFGWDSNVLKTVDRIRVSVDAAEPTRVSHHSFPVDAAQPETRTLKFSEHAGKQLGVLEIKHVHSQTAMLLALTNLEPDQVSMVYLDTAYGLRYPAKGMRWSEGTGRQSGEKELAIKLFGEEGKYSVLEILYPHVPTPSFGLDVELVEEKKMIELVLEKENVDVY